MDKSQCYYTYYLRKKNEMRTGMIEQWSVSVSLRPVDVSVPYRTIHQIVNPHALRLPSFFTKIKPASYIITY